MGAGDLDSNPAPGSSSAEIKLHLSKGCLCAGESTVEPSSSLSRCPSSSAARDLMPRLQTPMELRCCTTQKRPKEVTYFLKPTIESQFSPALIKPWLCC
ncbi:hypothetical protein GOP47_0021520 [Adiantum capillus-veneris]|uniref:Uncharacterized protein n=1 Tax=Adiantum capillus-veneris TaxID=13818 RepID=A0A9D4U8J5_ADICA|nr:hypothetical protein GOP47_0021520 [Adiantum capillus-veneris]